MKYLDPSRMSRAAEETALRSDDANTICSALISIAYFEEDAVWAVEQAISHLAHKDADVACAAATAVGHLARLHRTLVVSDAAVRLHAVR